MDFGSKLKELRKTKKMNQKDLAEVSGVSISAINKYESKLREPKKEQLIKIAKALEIPLSELIDDDININTKPQSDDYLSELLKDTIEINNVVNEINIPEIDLSIMYKYLRKSKIFDEKNKPYQEYIDNGCFIILEQKTIGRYGETHIIIKTLVYPEGIELIKKTIDVFKYEIKALYKKENEDNEI